MNNSLTVHPYPYLPAKIKIASRTLFNSHSVTGLTMGQAHNLVAAYLGFNSNQALLSAIRKEEVFLNPEQPETFHQLKYSIKCVHEMIGKFRNSKIETAHALPICCTIEALLFPECECCHNNKHITYPVQEEEKFINYLFLSKLLCQKWVCEDCINKHTPYEVGFCHLCEDEDNFLTQIVDDKSLCLAHADVKS